MHIRMCERIGFFLLVIMFLFQCMLSFCELAIMFPFQGLFCCECFLFNVTTTCYNKSSNIVYKFLNPKPITFKVVCFLFLHQGFIEHVELCSNFYGCHLAIGFITMGYSYCCDGHCDNVCGMKLDKV